MLLGYARHDRKQPAYIAEKSWLGNGFDDFLKRVPRQHLLRQLYMFSRSFDIKEASDRLSEVDAVMSTEAFTHNLAQLESRLGLRLASFRAKATSPPVQISEASRSKLRNMLEAEYQLLDAVAGNRQVQEETDLA